jgi:hypothetical protein
MICVGGSRALGESPIFALMIAAMITMCAQITNNKALGLD